MLRYIALPVLLQALLIIHVIRSGRDRFWIYILIFLPFAGGVAYLVVELLPAFFTRRRINSLRGSMDQVFNPGGKLKRLEDQASMSPTFRNICDLGDAYLDIGRFEEAATMYQKALVPPFEKNDEYIYKLAFSRYKATDYSAADEVMQQLSRLNMEKLKAKESLLWALIKEGAGDFDHAAALYLETREKTGDLSYQVDYARFLQRTGQADDARKEYQIIIGTYERLPPNYKRQYRSLIPDVQREYQELNAE